jgi:glyoxylase-like metal-dependent hydrolase (beta-lactamase superfamily II)
MELVTAVIGPLQTNVHLVADARTREAIVIDTAIPGLPWITGELGARGWRLVLIISTHGHWDHTGENAALQAWSREVAAAGGPADMARAGGPADMARAGGPADMARAGGPADMAPESAPALAAHVGDPGLAVVAADGRTHRPDSSGGAEIAAHPADWYRLLDPQPLFAPFPIPPCIPAAELAEGGVIRFGDVRLDVLHTPGHTEGSVCLVAHEAGILFSGDTLFTGGWGRVDLPGGDPDAMVASLARLATLPDGLRVFPGHGSATTIARERPWLEMVARDRRLPL